MGTEYILQFFNDLYKAKTGQSIKFEMRSGYKSREQKLEDLKTEFSTLINAPTSEQLNDDLFAKITEFKVKADNIINQYVHPSACQVIVSPLFSQDEAETFMAQVQEILPEAVLRMVVSSQQTDKFRVVIDNWPQILGYYLQLMQQQLNSFLPPPSGTWHISDNGNTLQARFSLDEVSNYEQLLKQQLPGLMIFWTESWTIDNYFISPASIKYAHIANLQALGVSKDEMKEPLREGCFLYRENVQEKLFLTNPFSITASDFRKRVAQNLAQFEPLPSEYTNSDWHSGGELYTGYYASFSSYGGLEQNCTQALDAINAYNNQLEQKYPGLTIGAECHRGYPDGYSIRSLTIENLRSLVSLEAVKTQVKTAANPSGFFAVPTDAAQASSPSCTVQNEKKF